MEKYIVTI